MTPGLRNFALTAHVTSSVGWLGAVAGFLALAIAGLTSHDPQRMRAAYLAMEVTGWYVIVPLSIASPLSGLVQSLGTAWGLFRHYWVVAKLVMTIPATGVLLLHMQPVGRLAGAAAETTSLSLDLGGLRMQLLADAGAALLVLLVATTLSVYKPRGMTPYAQRRQREDSGTGDVVGSAPSRASDSRAPRWVHAGWIVIVVLVVLFVVKHLAGGGMGSHTR